MSATKPATTLRSLVLSGFLWGIGTNLLLQVFRIAFAVALARFLTPHEYGIAAMALVFSAIVYAFLDLSLGVGLVQRPQVTEADRSTVFWTSLLVGVFLTLCGLALSGPIASFFDEPEVRSLFAVLSLSFVIGSLGATHAALLQRDMAFRRMNVVIGVATILGGVVGVGFAAAGAGAWSLIVQGLCVAVVTTVLLWSATPWRPTLVYSSESLRQLGSFGGRIFGVRLLDFLRLNGDKLLIGRMIGSVPLGAYTVAFNILVMPIGRLFVVIMDTLLPALSRLQDDPERVAAAWLRVNRVVAAVVVPALLGLAVVAPDFVSVLLGERWSAVAPLLQILSVGVIALVVTVLGTSVLTALNQSKALLRFSVVEIALLLAGVAVGVRWGVTGAAAAYSLITAPTRACFAWLTTKALGIPFMTFLASLSGVAQASVGMGAAIGIAQLNLDGPGIAPWLRLLLVIAVGLAVYVPLCLWRVPELRAELVRMRRERPRAERVIAATGSTSAVGSPPRLPARRP
jgi:O-antigen/teichoic acid export membrane protein